MVIAADDSSVRVTSITNLVSEIDLKTEIRAELVTIPEPQLTCEIQFDLDRDFHHITDDELVDMLERPNPAPCWWMRNPLLVLIKKHISQPGAVHKYRGRSDTLQGTSGKIQKLTTEQSILLKTLFKANVAMRRELQKGECDEVIDKYDVLRGLTWKKVKNTIHNWITLEKRKTKR